MGAHAGVPFFCSEAGDWIVEASCTDCGGFRLPIGMPDPAKRPLAEVRAAALLERLEDCPGCHALERRSEARPAGDRDPWWDPVAGEWMAPVLPGAAMPLGIRGPAAAGAACAAARALRGSRAVPVRVATRPGDVDPDATTVFYDPAVGRWRLRAGCFECGGFELTLAAVGRANIEGACDEALRCVDRMALNGCPHCRTRRERSAAESVASAEPWYDTESGEWVVNCGLDDLGPALTLPIGLSNFDVADDELVRAACSVAAWG